MTVRDVIRGLSSRAQWERVAARKLRAALRWETAADWLRSGVAAEPWAGAMSASFNVTILQPPGYAHSQALGEVWVYLADTLKRCGYKARASINELSPHDHNILLCGHLLSADLARQLPRNTIVFNSEKLEQADGWYLSSGAYAEMLQTFPVWDYSSRNIARIPHDRKAQIPLYYTAALKKSLPRQNNGPLLFYGCMTDHRAAILNGLQQAGLPVSVVPFGVYGDARDRLMYQALAVLNLHTDHERKVFEPVRCFHPLINGVPVITEEFHDEPMFDVYRQSTFVTGSDVVGDIVRLLADRDAFHSAADLRCTMFAASDPLPDIRMAAEAYLAGWNAQGRSNISA